MSYRGLALKSVVTAVGAVTVGRRYYAARAGCRCKAVPWDDWAGVPAGHKLTVAARRMVTPAGSGWSFDEAADKVREPCRLPVSDDVVRRVCDEEGAAAGRWLREAGGSAGPMSEAEGEAEFYTDGVSVNTEGGWREMRVSVFARRAAGEAVEPARWGERVLPEPTCRVAWAAVAASHVVGASWRRMLEHLGLDAAPRLSVLADGARWIWDEAAKRFGGVADVEWVVDVYHMAGHVHACGQAMFGAAAPAAQAWGGGERPAADRVGGTGVRRPAARGPGGDGRPRGRRGPGRADRLPDGQPRQPVVPDAAGRGAADRVGAGRGACKTVVGKRLKLNNPRWRVRRAEHMAALRCLHYSKLWPAYWDSKSAAVA